MHIRQSIVIVALLAIMAKEASFSTTNPVDDSYWQDDNRGFEMNTNMTVTYPSGPMPRADLEVIDSSGSLNDAPDMGYDDIEEDPKNQFVTTESGKDRPVISADSNDLAETTISGPKLHRVKRCGHDDDDDDANISRVRQQRARNTTRSRRSRNATRSRRSRKTTRSRQARTRKRAAKKEVVSKTVTTTVYRPGQLVPASAGIPKTVVKAGAAQPVVVQQPPAAPQLKQVVVQPGGQPLVVVPSVKDAVSVH